MGNGTENDANYREWGENFDLELLVDLRRKMKNEILNFENFD